MRAVILAIAIAACGHDAPSPAPAPPAAAPPAPLDARHPVAIPPPMDPPAPSGLRWRIPLVQVAAGSLELDWRAPDGATEVGLTLPLTGEPGAFDCRPLQLALNAEIERTWPHMVRPSRSKQLVISAGAGARNPDLFHAMDCVRVVFNGRDLYPDAMLAAQ